MSNKTKIIFFGTPNFAVKVLEELLTSEDYEIVAVVTQADKVQNRGKKLSPPPVKELALKNNIPVIQASKIKNETNDFIETIKAFSPDVGVVVAFGQILPKEVLNFPKHGLINIHASLLPRWRGAAPIQRAIMAGDKETGVMLMKMEEGLDTGPYYSIAKTEISKEDNFESLHNRLAVLGANLLKEDLVKIVNSELTTTEQTGEATYADKITKKDELVNWNVSVQEIDQLIRALSPFPGAYTMYNSKRLKILKATLDLTNTNSAPGQITFTDNQSLKVACKTGSLSLKEVQLEGKKRMSISDFLKGYQLDEGEYLG